MAWLNETIARLLHLTAWDCIGFLGEGLFFGRFLVQWIATEREKKVTIPVLFWYLSIVGSVVLLVYSFHEKNPVFALAFLLNIAIYLRNLYFVHRKPPVPDPTDLPPADQPQP
ncbi:MAG: lipid-A-disaccharide synthase N-terminal domain-containing protein [Planctomycetota bacterium]|jgi:lipid-A-disaccharide synthase-like uncharacterized protein